MPETAKRDPDPVYDSIGDSGKWQVLVVLLISVSKFPVGWHLLSKDIVAPSTKYYCGVPGNDTDPCSEDCKEVVYDRSIFEETAITEWDLICGKERIPYYGDIIYTLGFPVGNVSFGIWADKYGRRIPMCFSICLQLVSGVLASIAPWYWLFVALRFLCCVATGGNMLTIFCILMEIVGPGYREFFLGIVHQLPFNLGHIFMSPIVYFIRHFRWFQFAISIFSVVLLTHICLIPESPRWLILAGRSGKAIAILEKAATVNKMPTGNIKHNVEEAIRIQDAKPAVKKGNIADLFRTPNLRCFTLCLFFNWFAAGYYSVLVPHYFGKLGDNIFANIAFSAFLNFPGAIVSVPACKYVGRKPTLIFANLIVTVCMVLLIFITDDTLQVVLKSLAVFGAGMSFPTCYLYAGEIFPTAARNSGMGLCCVLAFVGGFQAEHQKFHAKWKIPSLFAGVGVTAMFLVLLLPETLGHALPETIDDAENYEEDD